MSGPALFGHDLFGEVIVPKSSGPVAERFIIPPFTILDAKSGDWQERKRAWLSMGIKSEVGRGDALTYGSTDGDNFFSNEVANRGGGTSIFDPVLCELVYRWFSLVGGQVLDPFAGGSVRGIVASSLGRQYYGIDLRELQVDANRRQAVELLGPGNPVPVWVAGDSTVALADAPLCDLLFSCPPYGDLEVYSDDPSDLSTMTDDGFDTAYRDIIARGVQRMKPDSFACFVVGDFRDKKGIYRNFVSKTIQAFEDAGARLYNEAILATPVGTACLRVTKQFDAGRKLAKTHQNVLVFIKGDPKLAAKKCMTPGDIESDGAL